MDYLTFSQPDFPTNQKLAMTAINSINIQMGYPIKGGTQTCSDTIIHPDGIQVAINLIAPCDSIAQKLNNLSGNYVKQKLPDDWYEDVVNKVYDEAQFDQSKVDNGKDPNPK